MTPLQKLIAELRNGCQYAHETKLQADDRIMRERFAAADMLEAQAAALKPFADKATLFENNHKYNPSDSTQISHRLGDFRAARTLATGEPKNE